MRIVIETIPHAQQRYDTVGDWQIDQNLRVASRGDLVTVPLPVDLLIRVSKMRDWRSEALVAVHELVEALLCKHAGITAEQVDAFDMGPGKDLPEPGADSRAPYHRQHIIAEQIEHDLCYHLGLAWDVHESNCECACAEPVEDKECKL